MSPVRCYRSSPHTPSRTSLLLPKTRQTFFQSACLIHFSLVWAPHEVTEVTRAKGRDVRLLSLRGRRGQGLRSDILLSRYCSLGSWAGPLPSGDAHRPPRRLQTAASQPVRLCRCLCSLLRGRLEAEIIEGTSHRKTPRDMESSEGLLPEVSSGLWGAGFPQDRCDHFRFTSQIPRLGEAEPMTYIRSSVPHLIVLWVFKKLSKPVSLFVKHV